MKYRISLKMINRSLSFVVLFFVIIAIIIVAQLFLYYDSVNVKIIYTNDDNTKFPALEQNFKADTLNEKLLSLMSQTYDASSVANVYSDGKYRTLKTYHEKGLDLRHKFDCRKLFEEDETEQKKVVDFHSQNFNKYNVVSTEVALEITTDCEAFRTIRGYRSDHGSQMEKEFPLAYVILVHTDFEHLERLLRTIYMPQHSICIHVDKKSPENLTKAVSNLARCFDNVIMASDPQQIVYAHISRLMADIVCMGDLLKKDSKWRYLMNYAATEFPMRTNLETVKILHLLNGLNDIHEVFERRLDHRFKKEYVVVNGRMKQTSTFLTPPPFNLTIVKGQAYNTFSREFVDWALTDEKPKKLLEWSEKTFSPDEHYWATLNDLHHNDFLNTPGGFKGHPDRKGYITRFISWQYAKPKYICQGHIVRNICNFSALDLPIFVIERHLAANKFDLTYDPVAYACMEELVENKTLAHLPFNLHDYSRLYFLKYNGSQT